MAIYHVEGVPVMDWDVQEARNGIMLAKVKLDSPWGSTHKDVRETMASIARYFSGKATQLPPTATLLNGVPMNEMGTKYKLKQLCSGNGTLDNTEIPGDALIFVVGEKIK